MIKLDQRGISLLVISLVVTGVFFVGSLIFAIAEFGSAQNYKNNVDSIAAARAKVAVDNNSSLKDKEFAEALKSPIKTYHGPPAYGSIVLQYPKTYSAYVDTQTQGDLPVDGYFQPDVVPGTDNGANYAIRVQVTGDSYDNELQQYDSAAQIGQVTVKPYTFTKVKGVVGVKVDGKLSDSVNKGTLILMPLRDKAIKLWTESDQYQSDFNKYVLPNFSFSP